MGLTEGYVRKVEDVMAVPGDLLFQRLRRYREETATATITGDGGQRQRGTYLQTSVRTPNTGNGVRIQRHAHTRQAQGPGVERQGHPFSHKPVKTPSTGDGGKTQGRTPI